MPCHVYHDVGPGTYEVEVRIVTRGDSNTFNHHCQCKQYVRRKWCLTSRQHRGHLRQYRPNEETVGSEGYGIKNKAGMKKQK
jgi:hypothetical protein